MRLSVELCPVAHHERGERTRDTTQRDERRETRGRSAQEPRRDELSHDDEEETWALVETHKGIGGIYTYTGRILRAELEAWRQGELRGALTLRAVYWIDEDVDTGRRAPIVVGRHPGFRNGTGVMHIAASTVILVMELRTPDPGVLETESGGRVVHLGAVREPRDES